MRSRPRGVDRESDLPPAMIIPTVERHQLNSSPSFLEDQVFSLPPSPSLCLALFLSPHLHVAARCHGRTCGCGKDTVIHFARSEEEKRRGKGRYLLSAQRDGGPVL